MAPDSSSRSAERSVTSASPAEDPPPLAENATAPTEASAQTPTAPVERPRGRATRHRILDILADLIITSGPGAVTLESVAAAAGISKGGLLHHFRSKKDLFTGLAKRLADELDTERAEILAHADPARGYIETSAPTHDTTALHATFLVISQHSDPDYAEAIAIVQNALDRFGGLVDQVVDDPARAALIRLVGDGLYFEALSGLTVPSPEILAKVIDLAIKE